MPATGGARQIARKPPLHYLGGHAREVNQHHASNRQRCYF